jgi:hypothetical protein
MQETSWRAVMTLQTWPPKKKFFNSVFMGETFFPIDMHDQLMEV